MAELSHDSDDGFHEIQLSGKQLVFLFMATTVVSVVIFLCGVLVGRSAQLEDRSEPLAAAPAAAEPAPEPVVETEPPAAVPPVPAEGELTYRERLQAERPVSESPARSAPEPRRKPEPAEPEPPVRTTPAAAAKQESAPTSGRAALPGTWAVQIVALRERSAAAELADRLVSKGYPAFVLEPAPNAPAQVYRVQVGRYKDRAEAEKVLRRLSQEEKFKPWITR